MTEYKYVPEKATEEMTISASQVGYPLTHQNVLRIWKAMLSAAPAHPSPEEIRNAALGAAIKLINERRTSETLSKDLRSIANSIERLKSQPAQPSDTEKDAARYRWLRDQDSDIECLFNSVNESRMTANLESFKSGPELDIAVDKAMKAQEQS